ncbi:MAG: hypothetical protein AMJ67_02210 [Betaproteobacteria bacterium SG8_41]|jgi:hypothetical protein|nr:MAG: hypothetical protein AMJ67_02210 [Betaproteobacteria bacterium SG8_41]
MLSIKLSDNAMRLSAVIILLLPCVVARAEITCEQLVAISQQTVNLRNQGASLPALLADTEDAQMKRRFTPSELEFIRLLISESFVGAYSPHDVHEACEAGTLAIPVRKTGEGK